MLDFSFSILNFYTLSGVIFLIFFEWNFFVILIILLGISSGVLFGEYLFFYLIYLLVLLYVLLCIFKGCLTYFLFFYSFKKKFLRHFCRIAPQDLTVPPLLFSKGLNKSSTQSSIVLVFFLFINIFNQHIFNKSYYFLLDIHSIKIKIISEKIDLLLSDIFKKQVIKIKF